ncbi:MAG: Rne/Rng family ribonuclease [Pseudomonadota bacterium]
MKRMLINATQAEERRLAIVDGQKLLDYEIEIEGREQRKGNIYKAVVTRVEPSLEACFVDYGEDRHGFLPFKEISKMYFQQGVSASQARIQDAIREGQELLVQVEKEERGNKGAALTTFVSLAGRYVVLMPNNPRGGGVSRRIEGEDRAELKEALDQLEYPNGMSIIARTAGIGRSAPELQWDLNYLLKLWTAIDGAAKGGKGAYLIYQESSLVIRAIRDYFNHDIGDILIDTDDVYEQAQQFMAHVMPEHAARVKRYRDDAPLFSRFQIEHQIESAYARTVQLPSGGAIVIDHTEALVSVDVNSARAIKGGDIEETATRTNLEAADEVARQMRLRDLGGLIVIDFIDMEESKNRREVENRLRDALRQDRARVQFGTISKFGLMEMSRQRLRPALSEGASIPCPRCGGSGHIRDTESSALQILRIIQEESLKDSTASVLCQVPVDVASFLLNEKRSEVAKIELKQRINVLLVPNKTLETPNYRLERLKHDDPRLDNIDASYKLADEIEDPTSVTRRSQEPTNKQTPIIKGVLPDAPAPVAAPRPVAPVQPAAAAQQRSAPVAPTPAPVAEKGFFGWIKSLFASEPPAPVKPVVQAPAAPKAPEGRGRDGNRAGGRPGEGRPEGQGRNEPRGEGRGPRGEGRGDGRNSRGGRGGRGGSERQGGAQRDRFDAEGKPVLSDANLQGGNTTPGVADANRQEQRPDRGPRNDRGERGNRSGRGGERNDGAERGEPRAEGRMDAAPAAEGNVEVRNDGQPPREIREGREGGRGGRGGRNRGPRQEGEVRNAAADNQQSQLGFADAENASTEGAVNQQAAADGNVQMPPTAQGENGEPREKRSRDRYGRERGPRGDRSEREERPDLRIPAQAAATPSTDASEAPVAAAEPAPFVPTTIFERVATTAAPAAIAPAPKPAPAAVAVQAPPAPVASATSADRMPKVTSYTLPTDVLVDVAQSSGLQWVNSDTAKIEAVQAAIAAEPKPIHVPRQRPAPVSVDTGPLVLVETKRDLRNMTLPFEQPPAA